MRKSPIILLTLFLLLFSLVNISSPALAEDTQLTSDEVLDIALAHPDVQDWTSENEYDVDEPFYANDTWVVIFQVWADTRMEMIVLIDDGSGEVTSIEYYKDEYEPYYDEYVEEAITFVKNLDILAEFIAAYPSLEWYGWSYEGTVEVNSYYWDEDDYNFDYVWMHIRVDVIDSENTVEFALKDIRSNTAFGSPQNSVSEIADSVADHPEVLEFATKHPNYTIHTTLHYELAEEIGSYMYELFYSPIYDYDDDIVYAEPANSNRTYDEVEVSEDVALCYCGIYAWLTLIVDDATGDVLEVTGTYTAELTEEEVLDILMEDDEIGSWIASLDNVHSYIFFDGYDQWWIDYWSLDTRDYGSFAVNDTSSEITYSYLFIPIPATRTEAEIEDLVLSDPEIEDWLESVDDYQINLYYDAQGNWYVYISDSVLFQNHASAEVDDATGEVSYVYTHLIDTNLDLDDIYEILRDADLDDFYETYPDAEVYMYFTEYWYYYDYPEEDYEEGNVTVTYADQSEPGYPGEEPADVMLPDFNNHWIITIISPTIVEASIELVIDDETGSIVSRFETSPRVMPTQTGDSVMDLIEDQDLYQDFVSNHTVEYDYLYYYDGMWYAWFSGQSENGNYEFLSVSVSDNPFEIVDIQYMSYEWRSWGYADEANLEDATADLAAPAAVPQDGGGIPLSEILNGRSGGIPGLGLPVFELVLGLFSLVALVLVKKKQTL